MALACPDKEEEWKPQRDLTVGQICLHVFRKYQMVHDSAEMQVRGAERCNVHVQNLRTVVISSWSGHRDEHAGK